MENNDESMDLDQAKSRFQEYLCHIDQDEKKCQASISQINTILPGIGKQSHALIPALNHQPLKTAPTYILNIDVKDNQPNFSRVATNIYRKSQSKTTDATLILSSDDRWSLVLNPDY